LIMKLLDDCPEYITRKGEELKFKEGEFAECIETVHNGERIIQSCFPLKDPELKGVEVCARVVELFDYLRKEYEYESNRIVFRRKVSPEKAEMSKRLGLESVEGFETEYKEGIVKCTHTAVCRIPVGKIDEFGEEQLEEALSLEGRKEIKLATEEHFAALRSYVHGISEMPLKDVILASYQSSDENPFEGSIGTFGFNSEMQKQVLTALRRVAWPQTNELMRDVLSELIESVPRDWILSRVNLLNRIYRLSTFACKDGEFVEKLGDELLKICVHAGSHIGPELISDVARNYIRHRKTGEGASAARWAGYVGTILSHNDTLVPDEILLELWNEGSNTIKDEILKFRTHKLPETIFSEVLYDPEKIKLLVNSCHYLNATEVRRIFERGKELGITGLESVRFYIDLVMQRNIEGDVLDELWEIQKRFVDDGLADVFSLRFLTENKNTQLDTLEKMKNYLFTADISETFTDIKRNYLLDHVFYHENATPFLQDEIATFLVEITHYAPKKR